MKYILIIWHHIYEREITFPNIQRHYDTQEDAFTYAHYWLEEFPEDIVMLATIETGVCKNCGVEIQTVPGAITYRWAHQSSITRVCFNKELTKAEPREESA